MLFCITDGNEPTDVGDVKFHQCVRLDSIENGRAIKLVPPDGEFEVMKYRLNTQVELLKLERLVT